MYIYRRRDNEIDAWIENHYWLKLTIVDGTSSTGVYTVVIGDSVFTAEDGAAGTSESDSLIASLQTDINASSEPLTAYDGANTNELLIRFDKFGYIPEDLYNQNFGYDASTTDDDGTITLQRVYPTAYEVKNASNWDGSFSSMQTVDYHKGHRSDRFRSTTEQVRTQVNANQLRHRTRFLFDPSDYSLDDEDVLFFQEAPVVDTVEVLDNPIQIVLSPKQAIDQRPPLILTGTAPAGASFDDSLTLELPRKLADVSVTNTGGTTLFFAFGTGSAELSLAAGESFTDNRLNTGRISLRGDGATTTVEIYAVMSPDPGL